MKVFPESVATLFSVPGKLALSSAVTAILLNTTVFVFYCCLSNCHKFGGLKGHPLISHSSGVRSPGQCGWPPCSRPQKLKWRVRRAAALVGDAGPLPSSPASVDRLSGDCTWFFAPGLWAVVLAGCLLPGQQDSSLRPTFLPPARENSALKDRAIWSCHQLLAVF